jgi:hypothetical protein
MNMMVPQQGNVLDNIGMNVQRGAQVAGDALVNGVGGKLDDMFAKLREWDPQGGRNLIAEGASKVASGVSSLKDKVMPSPPATPNVPESPQVESPQMAKAPSMGHDVQSQVAKLDLSSLKGFGQEHGGMQAANEIGFQNLSFAQTKGPQQLGLG